MAKIGFYGGAQEVTGANHMIETHNARILIDCGLFQCPRFCAAKNRDDFPYDPASVDALLVTHAHVDHVGRIPKLVRAGFRGAIYSTPPTRDFAEIMMEDSLGVLEKEAEREGEKEAIYGMEDVERAMSLWKTVPYGEKFSIGSVDIVMRNAGHILGSSMMEISIEGRRVLFTGDLGNVPMPLLQPTDSVSNIEYMIIESAYGDRVHEDRDERKQKFERAIEDIVKRKGTLIIPAFALERTQELLFELNNLIEHGRVPRIPVYIDSPLAIKATAIYKKHSSYFSKETRDVIRTGDDIFKFPDLHMTATTDESKAINGVPGPKMIIAGAGMMTGGRILHHARHFLPDGNNMVLFIGYQAAGSIGRQILDKARTVTIFGERVPVRAEVRAIRGYSAHADTNDLQAFVKTNADSLKKVFVVQGEPAASMFLVQRVRDYLGIEAVAPRVGDTFTF